MFDANELTWSGVNLWSARGLSGDWALKGEASGGMVPAERCRFVMIIGLEPDFRVTEFTLLAALHVVRRGDRGLSLFGL